MNSTAEGDPCDPHLSRASRIVLGSVLVTAAALGAVGNFVLGFYVVRNVEMRSLINVLLATMAISDTLLSVACSPFDFLTLVDGSWPLGRTACLAHSFLLSVLVVENVAVLVIISVDRYCLLVQRKDRFRGCHAAALISGCTAFSIVVSSPPLFGAGRPIFANEQCRRMCDGGTAPRDRPIYPLLYSGLLFVLPCGLLLLAYVHIIVIVRKRALRVHPESNHRMSVNSVEKVMRIHIKFKQKTFSTILCLYAAAVVCKLPLAVSVFVQSLTAYSVCPYGHWIVLLTYLNSAVNPFIYALKISEYWLMLTGKLSDLKSRVKSFRNRRSWKRTDGPQNIYMIATDSPSPEV